jgi:hypothetical protein
MGFKQSLCGSMASSPRLSRVIPIGQKYYSGSIVYQPFISAHAIMPCTKLTDTKSSSLKYFSLHEARVIEKLTGLHIWVKWLDIKGLLVFFLLKTFNLSHLRSFPL